MVKLKTRLHFLEKIGASLNMACIDDSFTYSDLYHLLEDVFDGLPELPEQFPYRVFTAGSKQLNQSEFGQLAEKIKVGVLANSDIMGGVMLQMVKAIANESLAPLLAPFHAKFGEYEISQILAALAEISPAVSNKTGLVRRDSISTDPKTKKKQVKVRTKKWCKIDIWTLPRLQKKIMKLFDRTCQGDLSRLVFAKK